jgi:tellurite resistance protein TerC
MTIWLWVGFIVFVFGCLALDLGVFNRKPHSISTREAMAWTVVWVVVSLGINAAIYFIYEHHWLGIGTQPGYEPTGKDAALQFLTAYLVEYSLSLDNIFVIAVIFGFFAVPTPFQHRVLFWGILGALLMRGMMIGAGIAIIQRFTWLIYVLGALLVFTAGKMLFSKDEEMNPQESVVIRLVKKVFPITDRYHGEKFFVTENGKRAATPLFLALCVVETTDVLFAVDSIPAVFSVTLDPFIVFTSNVCAILGLRSLYFALAAMMDTFRFIKFSLVFILAFVGAKMIASHYFHVSGAVSLSIIASALVLGIVASLFGGEKGSRPKMPTPMGIDLVEMAHTTIRTVKRGFILLAGVTLMLTGLAMVFLPGPGALIMLAGLAVLATEFVWAQVLLKRAQARVARFGGDARRFLGRK